MIALAHTVTTHPVEARQDDARRVLVNADGGRGEGGRGGEGGNGGRDENKKRETKRWQEAERADATVGENGRGKRQRRESIRGWSALSVSAHARLQLSSTTPILTQRSRGG